MILSQNNIKSFLSTNDHYYEIPEFQRPYSWTEEDAQIFLEDLETIHASPTRSHYFGTVVCVQQGPSITLIDGQQRATTTLLMLTAIYHIIKDSPKKFGTPPSDLNPNLSYDPAAYVSSCYLYNTNQAIYGGEENRIKLRTVTVDNLIFEKIYNQDRLEKDETSSRLNIVYRYFYNYFKNRENLSTYIDTLGRFEIIQLTLTPQDDDPQRIFESINSTGKPLTDGDKIRNFALMLGDPSARDHVYDQYWQKIEQELVRVNGDEDLSEFFRTYLISVLQEDIRKRELYSTFKSYFHERVTDTTDIAQLDAFYGEILRYLSHYLFLKYNRDIFNHYYTLTNEARRINYLRIETPFPFLMRVLDDYLANEIPTDEARQIFQLVESYLVRRLINGLGTKSLNKVFPSLYKSLARYHKKFDASYLDVLKRIFLNYSGDLRFPDDAEIASSIRTNEFYLQRNWTRLFILCSINDQSKESNTLNDAITNEQNGQDNPFSIEHIMPQTLSKKWQSDLGPDYDRIHRQYLHTLPNLTLTGYNSEYSNRPYRDKDGKDKKTLIDKSGERVGLDYSLYHMNQYFKDVPTWNEEAISNRAKWYGREITKLWPTPSTTFELPSTDELVDFDENLDLKNRSVLAVLILGEEHPVDSSIQGYRILMHTIFSEYPELYQKYTSSSILTKSIFTDLTDAGYNPLPLDTDSLDTAQYILNTGISNRGKIRILSAVLDLLPDDATDHLNIQFRLARKKDTPAE